MKLAEEQVFRGRLVAGTGCLGHVSLNYAGRILDCRCASGSCEHRWCLQPREGKALPSTGIREPRREVSEEDEGMQTDERCPRESERGGRVQGWRKQDDRRSVRP